VSIDQPEVIHMAAVIFDHPIRIGIVTGSEWFRSLLHASLDHHPSLKVVAEAEHGALAIEMVETSRPDVLLMDVACLSLTGLKRPRS
jgi:chemotaxis response regulator CheB